MPPLSEGEDYMPSLYLSLPGEYIHPGLLVAVHHPPQQAIGLLDWHLLIHCAVFSCSVYHKSGH